jgi:hypothetical protein
LTNNIRINRKDWDLTWNKTLEPGGMLVSEEIDISIELERIEVPQAPEVPQPKRAAQA